MSVFATVAKAILPGAFKVIDDVVADKDQAARLKHELEVQVLQGQLVELGAARDIIIAEAQGDSWLQRNWRPMLMLWFAVLVGAHWLGFTPPNLPESVVNSLLDIVQVGIGGYVIGRSVEKGIREWKRPQEGGRG